MEINIKEEYDKLFQKYEILINENGTLKDDYGAAINALAINVSQAVNILIFSMPNLNFEAEIQAAHQQIFLQPENQNGILEHIEQMELFAKIKNILQEYLSRMAEKQKSNIQIS